MVSIRWCKKAIRVICQVNSIVAHGHSVKLCVLAIQALRSQQYMKLLPVHIKLTV